MFLVTTENMGLCLFMKIDFVPFEKPLFINRPFDLDLALLCSGLIIGISMFRGLFLLCKAFRTSVSKILSKRSC